MVEGSRGEAAEFEVRGELSGCKVVKVVSKRSKAALIK